MRQLYLPEIHGQCIVSHRTGVVGRHLHDPEEIRKIRLADKGTKDRIDDVFYQRTDDVVESIGVNKAKKLAEVAALSADSFKSFVGAEPKVAMLSFSSYGSAKHDRVTMVADAVKIANEKYPDIAVDGELQLDAALVPEVAALKAPNSKVAGKANTLVFPSLEAGNIGYKLVQRLAKAGAYGPVLQGLSMPVNDLSRGCFADDIVGVVAMTAVQAQNA